MAKGDLKIRLMNYLKENPLVLGLNGQYEKIARELGTTAESVRCCIKDNKLSHNVRINNQSKRLPITFIDNIKPDEVLEEEREEFWRQMEYRSKLYIDDWKKDDKLVVKLPYDEFFGIVVLSDSHIGGEGCDYEKMRIDAEAIRNSDYLGVIHAGDLIDNFINSKMQEAVINATTSPKEQTALLTHWINTMTAEKILAVVGGNHDLRSKQVSGIDIVGNLVKDNKVHYCSHQYLITFEFPSGVSYELYMRHKYSHQSNINLTNCAKQLLRNGVYDSDIVIVAHNHEDAWELFNWKGKRRVAIRPSSYKVADPYTRQLGFNDSSGIMPTIILNPFKKEMEVLDSITNASSYLKVKNSKEELEKYNV